MYKSLTDTQYMKWFKSFLKSSNQHVQIAKEIEPVIKEFGGRRVKLLSIGAGTGCFEELLVQKYGLKLEYFHAIEPNQHHRVELEMVMERLKVEQTIDAEYFDEKTIIDEKFDLIMFVHSLYGMPRPAEMVKKARSYLKPDGKLIVVLQGVHGFADMRREITSKINSKHDLEILFLSLTYEGFSEELAKLNVLHQTKETETRLDMTDFINGEDSSIASFVVQTSYDDLNDEDRAVTRDFIEQNAIHDEGKRFLIQMNGVIIVNYQESEF